MKTPPTVESFNTQFSKALATFKKSSSPLASAIITLSRSGGQAQVTVQASTVAPVAPIPFEAARPGVDYTTVTNTTVTFNAPTAGTYIISIKFDSQSLVGKPAPSPTTTVHYDFRTIGVPGSTIGINLIKK